MLSGKLRTDNVIRRKNNEDNKNSKRKLVVVNQNPENQTKFALKRTVPDVKSYSKVLTRQ